MHISIRTVQREAWKKGGAVEKIKRGSYRLIPNRDDSSNTFICANLQNAYKVIKTWQSVDEAIAKKILKEKGYICNSRLDGFIRIKHVKTNETLNFTTWAYAKEWAEGV